MNLQPTSSSTLEDVLQDPNTDWSQIREAIKVSSGTALTNVGCVVGALNHASAGGGGGGAQFGEAIAAERTVKAADDDDEEVAFTSAAKEKTVNKEKNAQTSSQTANTIEEVETKNTPSNSGNNNNNNNNNNNSKNNNFEEDSLQRINEENDVMSEQRLTIIMSKTKKQQQQSQQGQQQQQQQTKRGSHSSRRGSSRRVSITRRGSIESIAESSIAAESILSSANDSGISAGDNSSIDIMDFGISQRQLSVVSSCGRSDDLDGDGGDGGGGDNDESGREESGMLSELCDSKGFLHWDPHLHQRQQQQQRNGSGSMNGSFRNNTTATTGGGGNGGVSGSSGGGDGTAIVEKARRFKLSEGLSNRTILIDGRYNMNSERSLYSECSVEVGGGGDVNVGEDDHVEEEEEVNMTAESSSGVTFSSTMDGVRQRRGGALDANNKQESIRTLDSSVGVPPSTSSDVQRGHYNKYDSTRALLQGTNNDADSVDVQSTQSSSVQSTATRTASTSTSTRVEDRRAIYTRDESTRTFESNYSVDSKGFMPWSNKSRPRGGVNREESTRTYDSWAQSTVGGGSSRTVDDSVDSIKGGGGGDFMHWDQTKKMSNLSLMFDSSNSINVEEEAEEEREGGDDVKMDASRYPAELSEILSQLKDERRRSSSSNTEADFTPAQLKYEPAKNNKLSVLQRMSSKLSTSLTSASTRTPRGSLNLATSLPSDQLDTTRRTYQRQHRDSTAWSLTSSDRDGTAEGMISNQDIKRSILNARSSEYLQDPDKVASSKLRSNRNSSWTLFGGGANKNRHGTDVATLSSSYSGCGEVPIRISREDNVNIEELRRDILSGAAAGDNREKDGGGDARRRKSSFSLFATSLDDEL